MKKKRCLFWGFTNGDLPGAVLKLRSDLDAGLWVGKHKSCDLRITDFFEYKYPSGYAVSKEANAFDLSGQEKLNVFKMMQREIAGVASDYNELNNKFNIFKCFFVSYLREHNIEKVVFSQVPHLGVELLLYYVCKFLSIETVMFYQTLFSNKFFLMDSIEGFRLIEPEALDVAVDISFPVEPQKPFYMNNIQSTPTQKEFFRSLAKGRLKNFVKGKSRRLGIVEVAGALRARSAALDAKTEHVYKGTGDYVYFGLHLQPELTTNPLGGAFDDQALAIELLRQRLPSDIAIVVKENPKQDYHYRDADFYKRLERLENTYLVGRGESSYDLLANCLFAATVTGTLGWEAVASGKPALVFGEAWYQSLYGAFRYDDSLELAELLDFEPDYQRLERDFEALMAYAYPGVSDRHYEAIYPAYDQGKNTDLLVQALKGAMQ